MTNQEKEFKTAFKHKHITNAEVIDKKVKPILKVYYRYKTHKDFLKMRKHIMSVADEFETLKYIGNAGAMSTKNYEYSVAIFKVKLKK